MPLSLTEFNHFYIINKVCGLEKTAALSGIPGLCPRNAGYDFIRITRVLCSYGKG